jgi:hypothetical protein
MGGCTFHFRNPAEGQTVVRKQHRQTIHEGGDSGIMEVDPEKSVDCGIFNPLLSLFLKATAQVKVKDHVG